MKKMKKIFIMLILVLVQGCANNGQHLGMYNPQFVPSEASRFKVSSVTDHHNSNKKITGILEVDLIREGFDPSIEMKYQLEKVLIERGLAASSDSQDAFDLFVTITNYDSTFTMPVFTSADETTNIFVKCDIKQHDIDMGKIKVRRTYQAVLHAALLPGKWKSIIESTANDIVDDLQEKIRQGK